MDMADVVTSLDTRRSRLASTVLPTGSLGLDLALGGGWVRGSIAELSGDYSTYKTAFALRTVAEAQKRGRVLWLDPMSDFVPEVAERLGVRVHDLVVSHPDNANEALWNMRMLASEFALVVCDSATLMDVDELDPYQTWFQYLKQDIQPLTAALFITHQNVPADWIFSRELRRWSSQQVQLEAKGNGRVHARVTKNPRAMPPTHSIRWRFLSDATFDSEFELVRLATEFGVIRASGSWLALAANNELLGQGIDGAVRFLRNDKNMTEAIRDAIKAAAQ